MSEQCLFLVVHSEESGDTGWVSRDSWGTEHEANWAMKKLKGGTSGLGVPK